MSRTTSHVSTPVDAPEDEAVRSADGSAPDEGTPAADAGAPTADADTPPTADAGTPDADEGGAGDPPAARRFARLRRPGRLTALGLVVVLLLGGNVWLLQRQWSAHQRAEQDAAAVGAARQIVTQYFTLTPEGAEDWVEALEAATTGTFRQQVAQYRTSVQDVLRQQPRSSAGTAIQAAVSGHEGRTVTVLLAMNVVITPEAAATAKDPKDAAGSQQFYRMRATMTPSGDRWLLSNLEVVTA